MAWDERVRSVLMIQCIQGNPVTDIFGHLIIHDKMLRSELNLHYSSLKCGHLTIPYLN